MNFYNYDLGSFHVKITEPCPSFDFKRHAIHYVWEQNVKHYLLPAPIRTKLWTVALQIYTYQRDVCKSENEPSPNRNNSDTSDGVTIKFCCQTRENSHISSLSGKRVFTYHKATISWMKQNHINLIYWYYSKLTK